jgi:hypothetical protein
VPCAAPIERRRAPEVADGRKLHSGPNPRSATAARARESGGGMARAAGDEHVGTVEGSRDVRVREGWPEARRRRHTAA